MVHTLLLRLAAPLQSWGTSSKYNERETDRCPSKSGVLGMLASALGWGRGDDAKVQRLDTDLRLGVRTDQLSETEAPLRDFHTARREYRGKTKVDAFLSNRYYLQDAVFVVGLESEDVSLLTDLEKALKSPRHPLFLGRRSCPPTLPLVIGRVEAGLEEALQDVSWQAAEWYKQRIRRRWERSHPTGDASSELGCENLPLCLECRDYHMGPRVERIRDRVISYSPFCREFVDRFVEWGFCSVKIPPREQAGHIASQTSHDAFSEAERSC